MVLHLTQVQNAFRRREQLTHSDLLQGIKARRAKGTACPGTPWILAITEITKSKLLLFYFVIELLGIQPKGLCIPGRYAQCP